MLTQKPLHTRQAHAVSSCQLLARSAGYELGYKIGHGFVAMPRRRIGLTLVITAAGTRVVVRTCWVEQGRKLDGNAR